jgi:hypothetical protein
METEEMKMLYKRTATKYREVHITDYGTAAFGVSSLYTYSIGYTVYTGMRIKTFSSTYAYRRTPLQTET